MASNWLLRSRQIYESMKLCSMCMASYANLLCYIDVASLFCEYHEQGERSLWRMSHMQK